MKEQKIVPAYGFPGYYVELHSGDVIGKQSGRVLKGTTSDGYNRVSLRKNGKAVTISRAKLLLQSELQRPLRKDHEVDHHDGDRGNNSIYNLYEVTHKENMNNIITKRRLQGPKSRYTKKYDVKSYC